MQSKLITEPTIEPVTLAEAKLHMRVDHDDEDSLITTYITAARKIAEDYCNRAFVNQTWRTILDEEEIPDIDYIALPTTPLSSLTTFKYYDTANVEYTWAASNYFVDTYSDPGRVAVNSGGAWPSGVRERSAIVIDYVAGYGAVAANVPYSIRTGILQIVASMYENREEINDLPEEAKISLGHYKVYYL